jgi:alpha-glucosidase
MLTLLMLACAPLPPADATIGAWSVRWNEEDGTIDLRGERAAWIGLRLHTGPAHDDVAIEENLGSFKLDPVPADTVPRRVTGLSDDEGRVTLTLDDGQSATLTQHPQGLALRLPLTDDGWTGLSADCDADEAILGLGSHAMDLDHVGEAFPLWTSEPGIGKSEDDVLPEDWFLTGTKHATSYPVPWLLRAQQSAGMLVETHRRVEVDLCAADAARLSVRVWGPDLQAVLIEAPTPLDAVRTFTAHTGRPALPPAWAFGPWADAIRGPERVRAVAAALREAGAPVGAIWTEDWKGANETPTGYRLSEEWDLDAALYPDAAGLDAELEALGFKWLAYFAPFVGMTAQSGADASAADALLQDAAGEDLVFTGVTFKPTGHLDPIRGAAWAQTKMQAAREVGFDGWMADYGEWSSTRAVIDGEPGLHVHNAFPGAWQRMNHAVAPPGETAVFCRSGWYDTTGLCNIAWLGDQRTSFDADDGLPTVLPLALGLSWSGVPITTHDVAGYQSVGNPPSDKELWMRWAALGAFSPIFRTHHGSFETDNWQFDSDAETLAAFASLGREHARTFPYRYGLAAQAAGDGTPMVLPTAALFEGEAWDRHDVWLLGPSLLVAPVLERGATGRRVDLPVGVAWRDWWTGTPAASGTYAAAPGEIPVFVADGSLIPLLDTIPDTFSNDAGEGVVTLADVDGERVLLVVGGGGAFTEADGTRYSVSGLPVGPAEATATLRTGEIAVGGATVSVIGSVERRYRVVSW